MQLREAEALPVLLLFGARLQLEAVRRIRAERLIVPQPVSGVLLKGFFQRGRMPGNEHRKARIKSVRLNVIPVREREDERGRVERLFQALLDPADEPALAEVVVDDEDA